MVTFDWDKGDCTNLYDFIEMYFFKNLYDLYDIGGLDNFSYLKSFVKMHDDLESEIHKDKEVE